MLVLIPVLLLFVTYDQLTQTPEIFDVVKTALAVAM